MGIPSARFLTISSTLPISSFFSDSSGAGVRPEAGAAWSTIQRSSRRAWSTSWSATGSRRVTSDWRVCVDGDLEMGEVEKALRASLANIVVRRERAKIKRRRGERFCSSSLANQSEKTTGIKGGRDSLR